MAKEQKVAAYVHHTGPSTHEELEKSGLTDVLKRDQMILSEAILDLYATVTEHKKPIEVNSRTVESVFSFICELSQIRDDVAFISWLEGFTTIMRGERAYRDVCGAAIQMLKDKGVTQDDFNEFVRKHCKEVK